MPTFCLKRSQQCERHPHTSGLHKSKFCVMPDPFPAERFGKGSRYARLSLSTRFGHLPVLNKVKKFRILVLTQVSQDALGFHHYVIGKLKLFAFPMISGRVSIATETTWLPSFYFNDRLDTMMATPIDEDTEVSAGQKFPEEVTAILERLYLEA